VAYSTLHALAVGAIIVLFGSCLSVLVIAGGLASPVSSHLEPAELHHATSLAIVNASADALAGYAVMAKSGSVSDVQATWNVPQIAAKCPTSQRFSAFWVGIDGVTGSTAEEIGTNTDCLGGAASYTVSYEYILGVPTTTSMVISPSNTVHAEVKYSSTTHKFTMSIKDLTNGKSFTVTKAVTAAKRSSAAWVVEAPLNGTSHEWLTDFGWVVFHNASATISGATHSISGFASVWKITMYNLSGTVIRAVPLSWANGGATFRINWKASAP
jgi:hypothetical protein